MRQRLESPFELHVKVGSEEEIYIIQSLIGENLLGINEGYVANDSLEDMNEVKQGFVFEEIFPKEVIFTCGDLSKEVLEKRIKESGFLDYSFHQCDEKDYVKEFYQSVKTFDIGRGFQIVPTWDQPRSNKKSIFLDPSIAFGTGDHPTTRMCVENLEQIFVQKNILTVLDVGTGTGILAMVAKHLGASTIKTSEIDREVAIKAKENFKMNGFDFPVAICGDSAGLINAFQGINFDLICSNILLKPNIGYRKAYEKLTHPGSMIIFSGVLSEQVDELISAYSECFMVHMVSRYFDEKDDWSNVVMVKKS